jgi:hypothetical protein
MSVTVSPTARSIQRRTSDRRAAPSSARVGALLSEHAQGSERVLARYTSSAGAPREVLAIAGAGGSVLVVDRNRLTRDDARLVAHVGSDEPRGNAAIAGVLFARHASLQNVAPRRLRREDFTDAARGEGADEDFTELDGGSDLAVHDKCGREYRIEAVRRATSIPELRWCRQRAAHEIAEQRTLSVREAVEAVEAYEPIRRLTRVAIACNGERSDMSVATLRLELERVLRSPIVLNRQLRIVVLAQIATQGVSMSEIAIRCGRIKRDRAGNVSGETSWLARRLGILPEGGREHPTRWIHTEVLALIARRGLGVSPREVEPD